MAVVEQHLQLAYRDELAAAGLLVPTEIDGLYLRSATYERIVRGLDDAITAFATDVQRTSFFAPPIVPRRLLEKTDYVRSFPDMIGVITSFKGGEKGFAPLIDAVERDDDWAGHLSPIDVALCPAACHSIYPMLEGSRLHADRHFEIVGQCFRHEPSVDPARMQAFRMHEIVYVGTQAGAREWREIQLARAQGFLIGLGLEIESVVANDPFFGRSGRLLASTQQSEALKFELVSPISSPDAPTAIASGNCHLDHFGDSFNITASDGSVAHSACLGFGVDRVTLALLARHGMSPQAWPRDVVEQLNL